MIKVVATLKSMSGSMNTRDYEFVNQIAYDKWFDRHNKDNRLGKIIGIHSEIHSNK